MGTTGNQDQQFAKLVRDELGIDELMADKFIDWVNDSFNPGDVFGYAKLEQWARANDFILTAECPEVES